MRITALVSSLACSYAFTINAFNYLQAQSPFSLSTSQYSYRSSHGIPTDVINELFTLHHSLISIPSVTYNEAAVAHTLSHFLQRHGLTVELQEVEQDRLNVYAYIGKTNDTKALLTSHIDTVPPYFSPYLSEDGGEIYGRGASDAKGSVAAQVIAFLELWRENQIQEGDLALLYVVGEEKGGHGMKFIQDNIDYKWESIILGEPTENKLGIGHKGGYGGSIEVTGKASHSGYPDLGIDAVGILINFLYLLKHKEYPSDELLGSTTLNIGLIEGGVAANVVPAYASANLFFRVAADLQSFDSLIDQTINETNGSEHIAFKKSYPGSDPIFFDYDIPGFDNVVLGYGTDAMRLKNKFRYKILYGPGSIHVAHGAGEYVSTDSLILSVKDYKTLVRYVLEH